MTHGNPEQARANFALPLPLTHNALTLAEQFAKQQPTPQKADQVRLNTLAVCAVNEYLQLMGISTLLSMGDSWNPIVRLCADVADLEIAGVGRLECRPMRAQIGDSDGEENDRPPFATTCPIPPEVWEDRIGYVVVQIDEPMRAANLLGFVETASVEDLPLQNLAPPEALLEHLDHQLHPATVVSPRREAIVLSQWFENVLTSGWQTIESLLASPEIGLAYGFRSIQETAAQSAIGLRRAKIIDLGIQLANHPVVLIVGIMPEPNRRVGILLQVHPIGNQLFLPPELRLTVLDESNATVIEAQSREADNYIQVQLRGSPEERFSVQVALGDASVTEDFVI